MDTNRKQNLHTPRRAGRLSVLLTLAALVCLLLAFAATANAATVASGYCGGEGDGTNLTWTLDSEGTLTISGTGKMKNYNYSGSYIAPWREEAYRSSLKKLVLSDGVSSIGRYAFYDCSGLTGSLTIPGSVITIGDNAFYHCSGFTGELTIPDSVTTIYGNAFLGCSGFSGSLTIPDSVTTIGSGTFANCEGFTGNLTIGNGVTTIESDIFNGCSGFTGSLTLGNGVTTIRNGAFNSCSGFTGKLVIPDGVTTIAYNAFQRCSGFTGELIIPDSVTTIGTNAFNKCSGFTGSLTIGNSVMTIENSAFNECSGFTGELIIPISVATIGDYAFSGCSGFTGSLTIPDSVTTIGKYVFDKCSGFNGSLTIGNSVTTIGDYAFRECSGFTGSLTIPDSVTTIGKYAFSKCSGFNGSLTIGNSVTAIWSGAFEGCSGFTGNLIIGNSVATIGSSTFADCNGFTGSLTIGNSVTTIGSYAFDDCAFTGSLTIPDSVTSIKRGAFKDCSGFTGSLKLGSRVTYLGMGAFANCSGFTGRLMLPDSVESIGTDKMILSSQDSGVFEGCSGFTGDLVIPENVTMIGAAAFYGCSGLDGTLTIGSKVSCIGDHAFGNCKNLRGSLVIPDSVTEIKERSFYGCSGLDGDLIIGSGIKDINFSIPSGFTGRLIIKGILTSIRQMTFQDIKFTGSLTIPDSVSSIGDHAFSGCSSFTGSLTIPESVTTIGDSAFSGCSGFTGSLTIPDSVTTIGIDAFDSCSGFTGSLIIPSSVTTIDWSAFEGCSGFTGSLTIPDSVTTIRYNAFSGCSSFTGSLTIPESVTTIDDYAFEGCRSIVALWLPSSVTNIGWNVFYNCDSLQTVYYDGTKEQLDKLYRFPSNVKIICSQNTGSNGTTLSFSQKEYTVQFGDEVLLTLNITSAPGKAQEQLDSIVWTSLKPAVFPENPLKPFGENRTSPDWKGSGIVYDLENTTGDIFLAATPKAPGKTTVTLTTADGASASCTVVCLGSAQNTVSMANTEYTIKAGATGKVFAHFTNGEYLEEYTWEWSSSNENVVALNDKRPGRYACLVSTLPAATHDDSRTFRAVNPGTAVLTCKLANGMSASRTITVLSAGDAEKAPTIESNHYDVPEYTPVLNERDLKALKKAADKWETKYKKFSNKVGKALKEMDKDDEVVKKVLQINEQRAKELMAADDSSSDKFLDFSPTFPGKAYNKKYPEKYKLDAYLLLCEIMDECVTERGLSFKGLSEADIIKTVIKSAIPVTGSKYIQEKNIRFKYNLFGFDSARDGTITLKHEGKTYTVIVCSTQEATQACVDAYLESCKKLADVAVKNTREAYIKDMLSLVGVNEIVQSVFKDKISAGLKAYSSMLKSKGLGDLEPITYQLYDYYHCYKTVYDKLKNSTGESYLRDEKDVQEALKILADYDLEGLQLNNRVVNYAYKDLKEAGEELYKKINEALNKQKEAARDWSKRTQINCAVNVSIFASDGTQIGYVGDDGSWHTDAISIEENDDSKIIYSMAEDQISFKVEGYESDYVSCVFEDFADGAPVGRFNFYDIWLDEGQAFQVALPEEQMQEVQDSFTLDVDGQTAYGEYISADQRASVNVTVVPDNADGGTVTGGGCYVRGDAVVLRAAVNTGFSFAGWYDDQDMLVSSDFFYESTAREDLTLHVKFMPHPPLVQTGRIAPSDRYEGLVDIYCEQSESGVMIHIDPIDSSVDPRTFRTTVAEYDADGRFVSTAMVVTAKSYFSKSIDISVTLPQYGMKIFILDADGRPVMRALVSE